MGSSTPSAEGWAGRTPTTMIADHANVNPSNTNTAPMSRNARSSPATTGPRKKPTLLMRLEVTFAAVSSEGFWAKLGNRAACAGRKDSPTTPTRIANAYTASAGPSVSTTPAAARTSPVRTTSAPTIRRRRSTRSASTATNGASTAIVTYRTTPSAPSAATPPLS